MKLIIQLPCYNEERTLPAALAALPRAVPGFDTVEWLVIDDGSRDDTAAVARRLGVDHVLRLPRNRGIARAFEAGLEACLRLGADVIVNTDGDNQYDGACIPELVAPILRGEAQVVLGVRPIEQIADFSWIKKRLQRLGSAVVRRLARVDVPDATTGFRAFSRDAALRLNVLSDFSYTLETLLQVGAERMSIACVPIRTNHATRPSRLFRSNREYILRSLQTLLRAYVMHRPLRVFNGAAALVAGAGLVLAIRYLVLDWGFGEGKGHVQSVIVAALLLNVGFLLWMMGLLADIVRANRLLLERTLYQIRRRELQPPEREPVDSKPA